MATVINIQNLPVKEQPKFSVFNNETIQQKYTNQRKYNKQFQEPLINCYDYLENENNIEMSNSFLGAFLMAYNHHGDIMISPDDVWVTIMFFFSKYVNDNAEELRTKLVSHEGQQKLIIKEYAGSVEESLLMEKNWDNFFDKIIEKISENTKDDIVSKLSNDFSTTLYLHKIASTSLIMNTVKKFFSYGRSICMCGINNAHFKGNLEDWTKLSNKIDLLAEYDVGDGVMIKYIEHVKIILEQFTNTFQNNVDIDFWNAVMSTEEKRIGSGGDKNTHIEGWILHFYGIYNRTCLEDMKEQICNTPIKLYNEFTNKTKDLDLVVKFNGVTRFNDIIYAPRLNIKINVEKVTDSKDSFFNEY